MILEVIFSACSCVGEVSTSGYRNIKDLQFGLKFGDLGL